MKVTQQSNVMSSVPLIGVALEKGLHQPVKPEPGERQGQGGTERAGSFRVNSDSGKAALVSLFWFLFSKFGPEQSLHGAQPAGPHSGRPSLANLSLARSLPH
jgi:hypothetical protein